MTIADEKLQSFARRLNELSEKLSATTEGSAYVTLSREYAELEPVAKAAQALLGARAEFSDLTALSSDPDPAVKSMAEAERRALIEKIETLEKEMRVLLLPKDANDEKSAIIELRGGTGGDEAALFAAISTTCISVMRRCTAGRSR